MPDTYPKAADMVRKSRICEEAIGMAIFPVLEFCIKCVVTQAGLTCMHEVRSHS